MFFPLRVTFLSFRRILISQHLRQQNKKSLTPCLFRFFLKHSLSFPTDLFCSPKRSHQMSLPPRWQCGMSIFTGMREQDISDEKSLWSVYKEKWREEGKEKKTYHLTGESSIAMWFLIWKGSRKIRGSALLQPLPHIPLLQSLLPQLHLSIRSYIYLMTYVFGVLLWLLELQI